jgi:Protein of unknown function (DUF2630)
VRCEDQGVNDDEILAKIHDLVAQERDATNHGDPGRRRRIEVALDQCWDLLRQREGLRDAGKNPDEAQLRPEGEVEGYLQ